MLTSTSSSTSASMTLAERLSAEIDALPRPYFDPSFDAVSHELALLSREEGELEWEEAAVGEGATARKKNPIVPSFDALEALAARRTLALEAASDRLRAALKKDSAAALEGLDGVVSVAGEVGAAARAAREARSLLLPTREASASALEMRRERARAARIEETAMLLRNLAEASALIRAAQAHAEDWGAWGAGGAEGAGAGAAFESVRRAREVLLSSSSPSSSSSSPVAVVAVARSLASAADRAFAEASARLEGAVAALATWGCGGSDSYSSSAFAEAARTVVVGFAARGAGGGAGGGENKSSSLSSSLLSAFSGAPFNAALKVLRGAALTGASAKGGAAASAASVARTLSAAAAVPREGAGRALSAVLMVFFDVLGSHHALAKFLGQWKAEEEEEEEDRGGAAPAASAASAAPAASAALLAADAARALSSKKARVSTWTAASRCVCEILDSVSSAGGRCGGNLEPGALLSWCGTLERAGRAFVAAAASGGDGEGGGGGKEEASFSSHRLAAERAAASALSSQASLRAATLQSMLDAESWSLLSVEEGDVPEARFGVSGEARAKAKNAKTEEGEGEEEKQGEKEPPLSFDQVLSEGNPWRPSSSPSSSSAPKQQQQQREEKKSRNRNRRRPCCFTASTFKALQWSSEFAAAASSSPSSPELLPAAAREASLRLFETVLVHFAAAFGPCSLAAAAAAAASAVPQAFSLPLPVPSSVASFCPPVPPRLRSALARALSISQPELAAAHGVFRKGGGAGVAFPGGSRGRENGTGATPRTATTTTLAVAVGPPRPPPPRSRTTWPRAPSLNRPRSRRSRRRAPTRGTCSRCGRGWRRPRRCGS